MHLLRYKTILLSFLLNYYLCYETDLSNFENPETLTFLEIIDPDITSINPEAFKKFKKVKKLSLIGTNIVDFPDGVQYLLNLEEITLEKNKKLNNLDNLNELPQTIKLQIQTLNLESSDITTIPAFIGSFKNLKYLNCFNNQIHTLPDTFDQLVNLKMLDLSTNNISTFPYIISSLTKLNILILSENCLQTLPDNFAYLQNLKNLDLSDNCFTSIPPPVLVLQRLSTLDLNKNNLTQVFPPTDTFDSFNEQLKCILKFELGNEEISVQLKKKNAIKEFLKNQSDIDLNDASFENLPFESFSYLLDDVLSDSNIQTRFLPELRELYIATNGITSIPSEFVYFRNLSELYAYDNMIETISPEMLALPNLAYLNLENNWLTYLPGPSSEGNFTNIKLFLNDNYIKNTCESPDLGMQQLVELKFKTKNIFKQKPERLTFENQVAKHMKEPRHWNLPEIWKLKVDDKLLQNAAKIKDSTMKLMWKIVIRHLIFPKTLQYYENKREPSTCIVYVASEEDDDVYEKLVSQISQSGILSEIKKQDESNKTMENYDLINKVTDYLNSISYDDESCVENTPINQMIKAYIKMIFLRILNLVNEYSITRDIDVLGITRALVVELCENGMFSCITGQIEKLQYYYTLVCLNENHESTIDQFIKILLGSRKECIFSTVTTEDNEQNVHTITAYRKILCDKMGLIQAIDDPHPLKNNFECVKKIGKKTKKFLKEFSIKNVINDMLIIINKNKNRVGELRQYLEQIVRKTLAFKRTEEEIYDNVISQYFHFTTEEVTFQGSQTKEVYKSVVALKYEGLERILLEMNMIVIEYREEPVRKKRRLVY